MTADTVNTCKLFIRDLLQEVLIEEYFLVKSFFQ